jgi:hypothetical protein
VKRRKSWFMPLSVLWIVCALDVNATSVELFPSTSSALS